MSKNSAENRPIQLGTMYKKTKYQSKELEVDADGRQLYTLSLNKDLDIRINGKKIEARSLYVNRPDEKLKIMLQNGTITEEQFDEKMVRFSQGGDLENIVFEIVIPKDKQ
jgi:hypothetical protein